MRMDLIEWRIVLLEALGRGLGVLVIGLVALIVARAGQKMVDRVEKRLRSQDESLGGNQQRATTLAAVSRSILAAVIWTFAILMALARLGVNLGPLIAGAGIAGVAVGFGAQSLVRDFFTGFFVLLEDQYRVGDNIEIKGMSGVVERFTLRLTSVRAPDGTLHHISNGHIDQVSNSSAGWGRTFVDVSVPYGTDLAAARAALTRAGEALMHDPEIGELVLEPPELLGVEALGDARLVYRISIKTLPAARPRAARAYRGLALKAFEEAGVNIAAAPPA